jgi:hypothetical protein
MRRSTFVVLALFLLSPAAALAQHRAGIAFAFSTPRGEFDRNTDTGYGLVGWYRYPLGSALSIGANGAFQTYGSTERRAPLSPTIPDIRVDVETTNSTAYLQGALELEAPVGAIRPYGHLAGGFGFFQTTTSLKDPDTDETIISATNQSDWNWMWGAGGGLRFRVHEVPREQRAPMRIYLDFGATWQKGDEVEYLREGSLVTDEGEVDIDSQLVRSETELVLYRLGIHLEF